MSQILSSIRVVKYFTWEKSVTREVQKLRHKELRLRGKLGDPPRDPQLIRTVRGEGYLFDAKVSR